MTKKIPWLQCMDFCVPFFSQVSNILLTLVITRNKDLHVEDHDFLDC